MAFVITRLCRDCVDAACVSICVSECPWEAIYHDSQVPKCSKCSKCGRHGSDGLRRGAVGTLDQVDFASAGDHAAGGASSCGRAEALFQSPE
jgi:hypothetical protein